MERSQLLDYLAGRISRLQHPHRGRVAPDCPDAAGRKVVCERLGHSTFVLTLDTYSHVLPAMRQRATARLEKLLYGEGDASSSDAATQLEKTGS